MKKRALISVFDKTGLLVFARFLETQGYEILSTGGTFRYLQESGLRPLEIAELTQFPEILEGRVKSLHPVIHAGILAKRKNKDHMHTLSEHHIAPVDMVVVNLYPFFEKANENLPFHGKLEFIDIGGPTMLRAAAKNFSDVLVITDIADYQIVQDELSQKKEFSSDLRKKLAGKVFNLTAAYDAAVSQWLLQENFPVFINASYKKRFDLRYGENPHQKAAYYTSTTGSGAFCDFEQIQGKELSFNNLRDMDAAWKLMSEFSDPAACALKHATPCGVALGKDISKAYQKAYACDPISIFGGIIAVNRPLDKAAAELMKDIFLEIILAPEFSAEALKILKIKKNLRLIRIKTPISDKLEYFKTDGGILVQERDEHFFTDYTVVTKAKPTVDQIKALCFAQRVVKHVKSNAIVVARSTQALGIAGGQTNRIWASSQAIGRALEKSSENLVLASDAFFPFRDVIDQAASKGITAFIQPGGSLRDADSIAACDAYGLPMIMSGMRHFKH
ncbi:bifunctional phosphoribosylaminoimidazolecarboxamide formyltransferase/IMP cyclohydrolase [Bacteroidetes bacterium endosymbiont of Geopemphigus sp.]|uniref:bifunctional phosphoribosylaminoimidazolecarboxamide formyltransferase/IMP cyclohydrolase n=1 Tax=Bacteroidetes bacterium endosymbiont of Geopemphigus sp. TaxID=2047937 RepID=UPI000CD25E01|nr:bifunctional phosphoribosylaminoimidazolecarboxamide formyltransferase/IMP cyclohydrolase [Bacteroidetes bacterium endosymbiont of Geopemphigus sp.]